MNEQKVRNEIQNVINELHSQLSPKMVRKQFAAGKAQQELLADLGILHLMPAGFGFSDAKAVIAAATNQRTAVMNAYGEGEEIPASALYQAIHEAEPAPAPETPKTDEELVTEWLQQEPPKPEELTEDDVLAAEVASDVLTNYRQRSKYHRFDFGGTEAGLMGEFEGWKTVLQMVKRGIAVLNGYLLVTNARVQTWQEAPTHKDAIVSRHFGAGYLAMNEMHRTMSLLPADDLITISTAAEIIYGENTQSKRVLIAEDIREGYLQPFVDRSEPNPQKATRLSKREVLAAKYSREN